MLAPPERSAAGENVGAGPRFDQPLANGIRTKSCMND